MDSNPIGSCAHGIFQARICEWVAISSSRGSSWPREWTCISCITCIGRSILYHWATWEALQCQNNNYQSRIISPWTWDSLLVSHSRKYFFLKTLWFAFAFSLNPVQHCILSIQIFRVGDKVKSITGRSTIVGMWKRLIMKSEVKLQKIQYHAKISCGSLTTSFLCPW